jgi:hypothetical protein
MHNCKSNRETLVALALDQAQSDQPRRLPAELEACAACREEYAAVLNAMRVAGQVKESALPVDSFWPGYRARLRQSLEAGGTGVPSLSHAQDAPATTWLRNLFASSVRVPIPLAAALLIFMGVSLVFALNSRRAIGAPDPIIITKTVEVPVTRETTREKLVTRVVYRDRDRRQPLNARRNEIAAQPAAQAPISLVGFKPANEVKLTIIKGSGRDEK